MRWPKTTWGMKIINFKECYGLTLNSISEEADVKVSVLRQVMIGKTPGYDTVEKVDAFIADYESSHTPGPTLAPFSEVKT